MPEFLLEIGTEEIPASMIPNALQHLSSRGATLLRTPDVRADATMRRLVVRASGVPEREPDAIDTITGPSISASPQALSGFMAKHGANREQLQIVDGRYTFRKEIKGRRMMDVLSSELPALILSTPFPKTMCWETGNPARFIRPIRWLVALFDDEIVSFEIAGICSSNITFGHRSLGAGSLVISIPDYQAKLRENFVLLSADERRERILNVQAQCTVDEKLLQALVYMTEYPTPLIGHFDQEFLRLPREVIKVVMRHHQNYFSVDNPDGTLAPQFVAIMNIPSDSAGAVRKGNERVLRARFSDARFFWQVDQRVPLADRVEALEHVTFQAKLGNYREKTERIIDLVGADIHARRAALLCKTDLTTELVKEFPELQGIIGGLYARAQGEPEEVATAIYGHYRPVSLDDSIPSTAVGQLVSLADKLDTLKSFFSIGLIPSGSRDPFGLRRAAQGVIKILVEGNCQFDLHSHLAPELATFLLDRVRFYFSSYPHDEVNAVIAAGWRDLTDVKARLDAIRTVRPTPDFEPLAASFKRIRNILKQADSTELAPVDRQLFDHEAESELYEAFEATASRLGKLPYPEALSSIASLRSSVDRFFDQVFVNVEDIAIRRNRLAMLGTILEKLSAIADFSEIHTSGS